MGVAIISGVIASLQSRDNAQFIPKWESHTPGTSTPTADSPDPSLPSSFTAIVTRPESAKKLQHTFSLLGRLGSSVQVVVGENIAAATQADVVILWYALPSSLWLVGRFIGLGTAVNHTKHKLSSARTG
jgi:pyrroline-5-carboxylate reductase